MIVWLNGTYGAGKTTTAGLVAAKLPARIFDSEQVGYVLQGILGDLPHTDFKEWPPWRHLTVETARSILDFQGGTLVIPQTVLQREYWSELAEGFRSAGIPLRAFTLHADREVWAHRVENDEFEKDALQWRLEARATYEKALVDWMSEETIVIDTTGLAPEQVADGLVDLLRGSDEG
ncbi:AAA family ATPase [Salininema proteolyticum]|uniref:AAA family ATPase n=1 Tax=Salininema proteolyticum TaxID=1607685 RepID=A0ABV8TVZ5_9ACTN